MELKDFVLYIRVFKSTLMEAVLSLTVSPNEKSMLRSVKPQKMEAAAGACEIHAPPPSPTCRRTETSRIASAAFSDLF